MIDKQRNSARSFAAIAAVCAAVWLVLDLPFRWLEFLNLAPLCGPKNTLPLLFGLMFGPAGCVGCAAGALLSGAVRGALLSAETLCETVVWGLTPLALYLLWYAPRIASVPDFKRPAGLAKYAAFAILEGTLAGLTLAAALAGVYGLTFAGLAVQVALSTLVWSMLLGLPVIITMKSVLAVQPHIPREYRERVRDALEPGLVLEAGDENDLAAMMESLEEFIFANHIPPKQGYAIQSCVEELSVLAFPKLAPNERLCAGVWAGETVVLELEFRGERYNPLAVKVQKGGPSANLDILGILMVRQMAVVARYRRDGGVNRVKLVV